MLHSVLLWTNVKLFYATFVMIHVNEQVVGMGLKKGVNSWMMFF